MMQRSNGQATRGRGRTGTLAAHVHAAARLGLAALLCAALGPMLGCDKPREAECKKAVANIQRVYGTAGVSFGASPQAMIRSCRGSASAESVKCFTEANSLEELQRCEGNAFDTMFGEGAKQEGSQPAQPQGTPAQPQGSQPATPPAAPAQPATPPADQGAQGAAPQAPAAEAPSGAAQTTPVPQAPAPAAGAATP